MCVCACVCVCVCVCVCCQQDGSVEALWSMEETVNTVDSSENGVFLLTGGVLYAQGTSRASVAAPHWCSPVFCHKFDTKTITAQQMIPLYGPPLHGVLCAAAGRPPQPAVAAMASG